MASFDVLFLTAVLFAVLSGIGSGVHLAFTVYGRRGTNRSAPTGDFIETPVSRKNKRHEASKADTSGAFSKNRCKLKIRVHDQEGPSFSEFSCQFSDEDHNKRLEKIRARQEQAYKAIRQEEPKI